MVSYLAYCFFLVSLLVCLLRERRTKTFRYTTTQKVNTSFPPPDKFLCRESQSYQLTITGERTRSNSSQRAGLRFGSPKTNRRSQPPNSTETASSPMQLELPRLRSRASRLPISRSGTAMMVQMTMLRLQPLERSSKRPRSASSRNPARGCSPACKHRTKKIKENRTRPIGSAGEPAG